MPVFLSFRSFYQSGRFEIKLPMVLAEISAFGQDMMVASYVAFLSAFAWLIVTQINTNKSFREAINEFRVTITLMDNRYKAQQSPCHEHRQKTDDVEEKLNTVIVEMARSSPAVKIVKRRTRERAGMEVVIDDEVPNK